MHPSFPMCSACESHTKRCWTSVTLLRQPQTARQVASAILPDSSCAASHSVVCEHKGVLEPSSWHHLAFTYNRTKAQCITYLDGVAGVPVCLCSMCTLARQPFATPFRFSPISPPTASPCNTQHLRTVERCCIYRVCFGLSWPSWTPPPPKSWVRSQGQFSGGFLVLRRMA